MKTVEDFIKARAALHVVCSNCDHEAFISMRLLRDRIGIYGTVGRGKFVCSLCRSRNVRMRPAADAAANKSVSDKMNFAGVYQKYED